MKRVKGIIASKIALAAGAVCLVSGSLWAILAHRPSDLPPRSTMSAAAPLTLSTDTPAETKPANYSWPGQANDPKYITLPVIHAEGFIQKVGVDQRQQIAVPDNIHIAGWFVQSTRPGEPGLSIIDGHVDGKNTAGIFKQLGTLKPGDIFIIERGNGRKQQFGVARVVAVPTAEAASVLFSQDPTIKSQLNLITCAGTYDRTAGDYDQRVIVVSKLVD